MLFVLTKGRSHRWVRRQSKDLILPPFNAALSAAYVLPSPLLFL